jgi:hypothetical protein
MQNVKDQNTTPKTALFSCYCSSSSRLKRTPTAAHTVTPAINTIYGLKKWFCSLAIKARDSPCTQRGIFGLKKGTKNQKKRGRTGGKKEARTQTKTWGFWGTENERESHEQEEEKLGKKGRNEGKKNKSKTEKHEKARGNWRER